MKEKLEQLLAEAENAIGSCKSENELQLVKNGLLGKTGSVTALLKEIPTLPLEQRAEMGKMVNQAKNQLSERIEARREELKLKESEVSPDFDCTVPGVQPFKGGLHPITQMCYDLNDAFRSMGFDIVEGPEVETGFRHKSYVNRKSIKR